MTEEENEPKSSCAVAKAGGKHAGMLIPITPDHCAFHSIGAITDAVVETTRRVVSTKTEEQRRKEDVQ